MSAADLCGPASADELAAVRWLDQVIAARDRGLERYAPPALRSALQGEEDAQFEVSVPIGTLRHLGAHIRRLKARELRP